jgi:CheY-like chemotaxis protein
MTHARILFVDDDVLNQWLTTDSLSALGVAVISVCRGEQAVAVLEDGYEFDLLLTALELPNGMSGFELAGHWRHLQPGRPILYTSAHPQSAIGRLLSDEGFVRKRANPPELMAIIDKLIEDADMPLTPPRTRRTLYIH